MVFNLQARITLPTGADARARKHKRIYSLQLYGKNPVFLISPEKFVVWCFTFKLESPPHRDRRTRAHIHTHIKQYNIILHQHESLHHSVLLKGTDAQKYFTNFLSVVSRSGLLGFAEQNYN